MSISSLTSPPEKSSRRVRFSLPEAKLTLTTDKRTLHGTTKYVNGTLINVTSTIHSANEKGSSKNEINGVFKSSLKSNGNGIPTKETSQYKVSLNIRPTSVAGIKEHGRNSLPMTTSAGLANRRKLSKTITRKSFNTLPIIERKSSSLEDFDEDSLDGDQRDDFNTKSKQTTNLARYKSSEDLRDPNNFKMKSTVLKLPEAPNGQSQNFNQKKTITSNTLKVPEYSESLTPSLQSCETNRKLKSDLALCDKNDDRLSVTQIDSSNGNLEQFFDFVDKWRANRLAGNKKIDDIFRNSSFQSRCSFKNSDSKRLRVEKL